MEKKQISFKVNVCKTTKSPNNHYNHLNHYLLLVVEVVVGEVIVVGKMIILGWVGLEGVVAGTMIGCTEFVLLEATIS